jgi:hypothetical protein
VFIVFKCRAAKQHVRFVGIDVYTVQFGVVKRFFKGTVSRDFRLMVFFINQFPPSL